MSVVTFSKAPNNTSDTYFRDWGSTISSAISTVGWVQTSDTGQINWTTVTYPTAADTSKGYEIWRMNDSLQSTAPLFLKIEYGSGGGAGFPALWVTVGTGTDGAGNLTGQVSTRRNLRCGNYTATLTPGFVSGTSSRLLIGFCIGNNGNNGVVTYGMVVSVERSHDTSGADTSGGALILTWSNSGPAPTTGSQYLPSSGTIPSVYTGFNCSSPPTGTGAVATDVYLYPVRGWMPGETSASLNVFAYFTADLTTHNAVSTTGWDGNTFNILPISNNSPTIGPPGTVYMALRYS